MYEASEHMTAELGMRRRPTRRVWLALIPTAAAVLVLLFAIGAACHARSGGSETPLGAVGTPTPTVAASGSPEPSEPADAGSGSGTGSGQSGGGSGAGGPSTGGGATGGGGPGGNQGGPDPADAEEPQPLGIAATVSAPMVQGACTAGGRIAVTGGDQDDFPLTLTFRWYWMPVTDPPGLLPEPVQFGGDTDVLFAGSGEVGVTSPSFPDDEDAAKNRVMLQVAGGSGETDSEWVTYPECGQAFG